MSNDASSGTIHHLQPLYLNNYSSDCFSEAFNASFLNQTKQTIHCRLPSSSCTIHHLQSLYLKSCSNDCFLEAFNASSLYQTKQTSHCRLVLFITFNLYTWKVAWVVAFRRYLMHHLSTKQNKQAITLMTRHCTTPQLDSYYVVVFIVTAMLS